MLLGRLVWPFDCDLRTVGHSNVASVRYAGSFEIGGELIEVRFRSMDFPDDDVFLDACFGIFEGNDETDPGEGDWLLDGANFAFVLFLFVC